MVTDKKDEALKLALEALEVLGWQPTEEAMDYRDNAITAIREALAEQPAPKWQGARFDSALHEQPAPPECQTEAEKTAFAFGWFKALEQKRKDEQPAQPPASPEELAKLGWQSIECPFCGSSGAQAFPKPAQQQEPVAAIRALTNQCAALIQERDELQKQVWRYEKNGVTCQTYRHKIDRTCSECNVQEDYTSPQPSKPCEWQQEDSEHMPDTWRSDCGVLWTFTDGGPIDNDMKHCCGCGAKLKEKNNG